MGYPPKKTGICSAFGCKNSAKKGFIVKSFPKDAVRKQQWLMKMKRPRWKPAENAVLCEVHFEPGMWDKTNGKKNLKKDAVPTIFSFQPKKRKRKYNDSDSSEEDSEEPSDSSDPSYVASDSEAEDLTEEEEELPRTRTRSGNKRLKAVSSSKKEETSDEGQNPKKPDTPTKPAVEVNEKVYNPFSQIKQPANSHPVHPDVRFSRLPFFDTISELLKPSMLKPQNVNVNEENFHFYFTPQQVRDIINARKSNSDGLCEFGKQVQLRFCLAETICEQEDYFPKGLMVQVNHRLFPLPNPIPTNKPDQEPKRPSRQLNITPLVKLTATTANAITVIWTSDPGPGYVLSVTLVNKLSSQDLLERLKKKGAMHSDHTRALIKEKLNEEDAEIMTTHLRVSLMCPLGRSRMIHPCRATTCKHLQCFDGFTYLQMNERKATWSCPVCDKPALFDNLTIDGYFQEVLMSSLLPCSTNEIELNKDGSWNVQNIVKDLGKVPIDESIEIIGDDGDDPPPMLPTSTTKDNTVDHIEISDSDSNDVPSPKRPSSVINLDSSPSSEDGDDGPILDPASGNLIPNPKAKKQATASESSTSDSTSTTTSASSTTSSSSTSTIAPKEINSENPEYVEKESTPTALVLKNLDGSLSEPPADNSLRIEKFLSEIVDKSSLECDVEKVTPPSEVEVLVNPPVLEGPFPHQVSNDLRLSMPDLDSDNMVSTTSDEAFPIIEMALGGDSFVDSSSLNV